MGFELHSAWLIGAASALQGAMFVLMLVFGAAHNAAETLVGCVYLTHRGWFASTQVAAAVLP